MSIAQHAQALMPVFVTAPTARNGVTLIQRLLNSTRQIIVYGENLTLMSTLPSSVHSNVFFFNTAGAELKESRERFLSGDSEYWTSNLWPDVEAFMLQLFDAFYRGVTLYDESSKRDGFQRWGIKTPMDSPQMISRMRSLMPRARFVFIYRDPFEVLRSAKARNFVTDLHSVREYTYKWARHTNEVLADDNGTLLVPHHELVESPAQWIDELERFTGVRGIDRSVMERRINTFGDEGYVDPTPLTNDEEAVIREVLTMCSDDVRSAFPACMHP